MELPTRRQEAKQAFLDLFAGMTGLNIGLYEMNDGSIESLHADPTFMPGAPYCQMIHALPGGEDLCSQDQCARAREAFGASTAFDALRICHAGLWNQTVPVRVNNAVRAVLSYGEMQIEGPTFRERTLQGHEEVIRRLGLNPEQAAALRETLLATRTFTPEQLEGLANSLPKIKQWFYTLIDEEDYLRRNVENVSHEIQTRLQAVLADADNLCNEFDSLSQEEMRERIDELLYAAQALDTVVQNLESEYLEEYQFIRQPLLGMLMKARNLYFAEARRRGIEIHIHLHPDVSISLSEHHIQLALNNLMHNAIKYSFRSAPGRTRYVRVTGRADHRYYRLIFENYGVGILPEEIAGGLLFQDSYQGKLTQGEYRTGSGKGLYFVKRIIDRHHGQILVESELMANQNDPEGQPHLNRFTLLLPYEQPRG